MIKLLRNIFIIAAISFVAIYSVVWYSVSNNIANKINKHLAANDNILYKINGDRDVIRAKSVSPSGFPFVFGLAVEGVETNSSIDAEPVINSFDNPVIVGYDVFSSQPFIAYSGGAKNIQKILGNDTDDKDNFLFKVDNLKISFSFIKDINIFSFVSKLQDETAILIEQKKLFNIDIIDVIAALGYLNNIQIKYADLKFFDNKQELLFESDNVNISFSHNSAQEFLTWSDFLNKFPNKWNLSVKGIYKAYVNNEFFNFAQEDLLYNDVHLNIESSTDVDNIFAIPTTGNSSVVMSLRVKNDFSNSDVYINGTFHPLNVEKNEPTAHVTFTSNLKPKGKYFNVLGKFISHPDFAKYVIFGLGTNVGFNDTSNPELTNNMQLTSSALKEFAESYKDNITLSTTLNLDMYNANKFTLNEASIKIIDSLAEKESSAIFVEGQYNQNNIDFDLKATNSKKILNLLSCFYYDLDKILGGETKDSIDFEQYKAEVSDYFEKIANDKNSEKDELFYNIKANLDPMAEGKFGKLEYQNRMELRSNLFEVLFPLVHRKFTKELNNNVVE